MGIIVANVMDWGIEMGIFPGIINYCLYVYQGSFSCLLGQYNNDTKYMYSVVGNSVHCDSFTIHQTDDAGSESFS